MSEYPLVPGHEVIEIIVAVGDRRIQITIVAKLKNKQKQLQA